MRKSFFASAGVQTDPMPQLLEIERGPDKKGVGRWVPRDKHRLLAEYLYATDREAIAFDMERAGFGPDIKAKAMEVADATATIVASNFADGFEQLESLKRRYGQEPWFKLARGNFTDLAPEKRTP